MANVIEIVIRATDQATAQIRGTQAAVTGLQASMAGLLAAAGGPVGIALALGAAGAAGLKMAGDFSDTIEQLDNLSRVTGVSVNDLRVLRQAMTEAGKSPESLDRALGLLRRNIESNSPALRKIIGDTTDTMTALELLSKAAAGPQGSAAVSFAAFGRGGLELAPILGDLGARVEDLRGRMVKLGPEALQAARDFDEAMDTMKTAAGELGAVVAPFFAKVMVGSIGILIASFKALKGEGIKALSELARAIASMTGSVIPGPEGAAVGSGGGTGPPDPLALMRQNFGDTGFTAGQRSPVSATQEQWKLLVDTWNDAEPVAKKVAVAIDDQFNALEAVSGLAVNVIADSFRTMFDSVLIYGENFVSSLGNMLKSIASQIASIALQIGLGTLLAGTGGGTGFFAKIGQALLPGSMGAPRGDTINISTLDTRSLRMQMMPGGSFARAQDQVRIGGRY